MVIRALDILFASLALLILAPLLLPICLILRFSGEKEVLYLQPRVGKNQSIFYLYKFTTMVKNSSDFGSGDITIKDDPRVLPFGKLLRKTKINELPQLLNIIFGDMSIVGPRPLVKKTFDKYENNCIDIASVKPGLTGIGSLIFRDEESILDKSNDPIKFYFDEIHPYKGTLEVWFVKNMSIKLYFQVILLTVWVLLFPRSNLPFQIFGDLPDKPNFLEKT